MPGQSVSLADYLTIQICCRHLTIPRSQIAQFFDITVNALNARLRTCPQRLSPHINLEDFTGKFINSKGTESSTYRQSVYAVWEICTAVHDYLKKEDELENEIARHTFKIPADSIDTSGDECGDWKESKAKLDAWWEANGKRLERLFEEGNAPLVAPHIKDPQQPAPSASQKKRKARESDANLPAKGSDGTVPAKRQKSKHLGGTLHVDGDSDTQFSANKEDKESDMKGGKGSRAEPYSQHDLLCIYIARKILHLDWDLVSYSLSRFRTPTVAAYSEAKTTFEANHLEIVEHLELCAWPGNSMYLVSSAASAILSCLERGRWPEELREFKQRRGYLYGVYQQRKVARLIQINHELHKAKKKRKRRARILGIEGLSIDDYHSLPTAIPKHELLTRRRNRKSKTKVESGNLKEDTIPDDDKDSRVQFAEAEDDNPPHSEVGKPIGKPKRRARVVKAETTITRPNPTSMILKFKTSKLKAHTMSAAARKSEHRGSIEEKEYLAKLISAHESSQEPQMTIHVRQESDIPKNLRDESDQGRTPNDDNRNKDSKGLPPLLNHLVRHAALDSPRHRQSARAMSIPNSPQEDYSHAPFDIGYNQLQETTDDSVHRRPDEGLRTHTATIPSGSTTDVPLQQRANIEDQTEDQNHDEAKDSEKSFIHTNGNGRLHHQDTFPRDFFSAQSNEIIAKSISANYLADSTHKKIECSTELYLFRYLVAYLVPRSEILQILEWSEGRMDRAERDDGTDLDHPQHAHRVACKLLDSVVCPVHTSKSEDWKSIVHRLTLKLKCDRVVAAGNASFTNANSSSTLRSLNNSPITSTNGTSEACQKREPSVDKNRRDVVRSRERSEFRIMSSPDIRSLQGSKSQSEELQIESTSPMSKEHIFDTSNVRGSAPRTAK